MRVLDDIDREILMSLQRGIPIVSRPYQVIAEEIGNITEKEVIFRIEALKKDNIIRRMSGFFNSPKLGYVSTLVAVKAKEGYFDEAVELINSYTGITHNYLREHKYSIWFTLIAINHQTMNHILEVIKGSTYIESLLSFDMQKRYKIDVTFDVRGQKKSG